MNWWGFTDAELDDVLARMRAEDWAPVRAVLIFGGVCSVAIAAMFFVAKAVGGW